MPMIEVVRPDIAYDSYLQARNRLENGGFFYYPCAVDDWLKEHDEELAIWKNERTNRCRVTGHNLWTIMEFDGHELDYRIVDRMKRIDSRAGWSAIAELRKADAAREKAQERLTEDIAYNFGKDVRSAVKSL